jgi:hypothetical protein
MERNRWISDLATFGVTRPKSFPVWILENLVYVEGIRILATRISLLDISHIAMDHQPAWTKRLDINCCRRGSACSSEYILYD